MKIKTSELIGPALDWAVAKCEEVSYTYQNIESGEYGRDSVTQRKRNYSTSWQLGGPIIERKKIGLTYSPDINCVTQERFPRWIADNPSAIERGPKALTAAMRCYVASNLGDEIEVPDELVAP